METNFNTNVGTSMETNHTLDVSDRLYKVAMAFVGVVALAFAGFGVYAFTALPQNAPHEINVTGQGKAYAKPDVATISFGAHTEAAKSQDAVSKNNAIMDAVTKAIKAQGVDDKDIQTTLYNLQPVYDYNYPVPMMGAAKGSVGSSGMGIVAPSYPVRQTTLLRGYSLDQQIQVKIRNFDKINAILDAASQNGANTIGSLQFTVDDMEKVKSQARQDAIDQAKDKAMSMFREAGLGGAKLVNISEGYGYPMYGLGDASMEKSANTTMPAPNVQPGQMEIDTTITLTYRVK